MRVSLRTLRMVQRCQGAVKVCQPSAVESVPLLNVRAVKFSFDREGEFSDVKQDRYVE